MRLFDHAREAGVSEACRVFGIHRSTYYRWKAMVERSRLEMLRSRERRAHGEVGELLAVEDLGLEDGPQGLDLAVGPGRVDLRPDVAHFSSAIVRWKRLSIERAMATKACRCRS